MELASDIQLLSNQINNIENQLDIPSDNFPQIIATLCRNFVKKYQRHPDLDSKKLVTDLKTLNKELEIYTQHTCETISKYQSLTKLQTLTRSIFEGQAMVLTYVVNIIEQNLNDSDKNVCKIENITQRIYQRCQNCSKPFKQSQLDSVQQQIGMRFKDRYSFFQRDFNEISKLSEQAEVILRKKNLRLEGIAEQQFMIRFEKIQDNVSSTIDNVTQSLFDLTAFQQKFSQIQQYEYTRAKNEKQSIEKFKFVPKNFMIDMSKHFYSMLRKLQDKIDHLKRFFKVTVNTKCQTTEDFSECNPQKIQNLKQIISKLELENKAIEVYMKSQQGQLNEGKAKYKYLDEIYNVLKSEKEKCDQKIKILEVELSMIHDKQMVRRKSQQFSDKLIDFTGLGFLLAPDKVKNGANSHKNRQITPPDQQEQSQKQEEDFVNEGEKEEVQQLESNIKDVSQMISEEMNFKNKRELKISNNLRKDNGSYEQVLKKQRQSQRNRDKIKQIQKVKPLDETNLNKMQSVPNFSQNKDMIKSYKQSKRQSIRSSGKRLSNYQQSYEKQKQKRVSMVSKQTEQKVSIPKTNKQKQPIKKIIKMINSSAEGSSLKPQSMSPKTFTSTPNHLLKSINEINEQSQFETKKYLHELQITHEFSIIIGGQDLRRLSDNSQDNKRTVKVIERLVTEDKSQIEVTNQKNISFEDKIKDLYFTLSHHDLAIKQLMSEEEFEQKIKQMIFNAKNQVKYLSTNQTFLNENLKKTQSKSKSLFKNFDQQMKKTQNGRNQHSKQNILSSIRLSQNIKAPDFDPEVLGKKSKTSFINRAKVNTESCQFIEQNMANQTFRVSSNVDNESNSSKFVLQLNRLSNDLTGENFHNNRNSIDLLPSLKKKIRQKGLDNGRTEQNKQKMIPNTQLVQQGYADSYNFTELDIKTVYFTLKNAFDTNHLSLKHRKSLSNLSTEEQSLHPKQINYIKQFFTKIANIHITNKKAYEKIKLFLICPYDLIVSEMTELKIIKGGSYSNAMRQSLRNIVVMHRNCTVHGEVCKHLKYLYGKVGEFQKLTQRSLSKV